MGRFKATRGVCPGQAWIIRIDNNNSERVVHEVSAA